MDRFKQRVDNSKLPADSGGTLSPAEQEIFVELDHRLKHVLVINPSEPKYRITTTVWKAKKILGAIELIHRFVNTFEKEKDDRN